MAENQVPSPENFPSAPPPPQEVKIRTMRSDLASMAQGGGLPQFQKVRIDAPAGGPAGALAPSGDKKINLGIAIVVVAIVVVVAVVGYFVFVSLKR